MGLDVVLRAGSDLMLPLADEFEHGLLVTQGEIEVDGSPLVPGTLLYLPPGRAGVSLRSSAAARVTVIGGEPLEEPVLMWWNFVGRDKDELTHYCREWNAEAAVFGEVKAYDGARLTAPLPPWTTA
jgi:redox-sensitive bicupin YhaK (pirin superfamily)